MDAIRKAVIQRVNRRRPDSDQRATNFINVDVVGGGHGLDGLFSSVRSPNDICIIIDNASELLKVSQDVSRLPNHFVLPIGERDTTSSLLEKAYGEDHEIQGKIGNAIAAEGMGQRGGLGAIACQQLIRSRVFLDLLDNLADRILFLSKGNLTHVNFRSFGSGAGGTNSQIARILGEALVKKVGKLGVTIKYTFHMTDSLSFTGLGASIHANQAVALQSIHELITKPKKRADSRVVWALRLIGSIPLGADSKRRQELLLLDRQAWMCFEMQARQQITEPNYALSGRYGNVCHSSTDFYRSLPRELVAATVASDYFAEIQEAIDRIHPVASLIDYIEPNHSQVSRHRNSIEWVVDSSDSLTVADMLQATMQPDAEHQYRFEVIHTAGETYDCELIAEHFVTPPNTLDEAVHNAVIVATIAHVLRNEQIEIEITLSSLESKITKAERQAESAFKQLQGARVFFNSAKKRAFKAATELRRLADQLATYQAMKSELDKSADAAAKELGSQLSRLRQLVDVLDYCRTKGRVTEQRSLFYFNRVDEAFRDLLTLPTLDPDRQTLVLAAQAIMVTVEGMQYILGASVNTVEALARAATGPAHLPGAWPGAVPRHGTDTIYVLPPTNAELNAALKSAIQRMSPNSIVLTADSVDLGINVVRFHVFHPQRDDELLPGLLQAEYDRATEGPTRLLHQDPGPEDSSDSSDDDNTEDNSNEKEE